MDKIDSATDEYKFTDEQLTKLASDLKLYGRKITAELARRGKARSQVSHPAGKGSGTTQGSNPRTGQVAA